MVIIMERREKGFTLVELLAVIVILAILALIAIPNVSSLVRKSKTNMFCKKVESIEAAAKNYAQDNLSNLATSEKTTVANRIPLSFLVEKGYLNKDSKDCIVGTNCVLDERSNTYLDNNYVEIYSENNRLYGRYLYSREDATNNICHKKDSTSYSVSEYGTYNQSANTKTNDYSRFDINSPINSANTTSNLPFYFDLYVDGVKISSGVSDYCSGGVCSGRGIKKGSVYEIKNIRSRSDMPGFTCQEYGYAKNSYALSGVLIDDSVSVDVVCLNPKMPNE